MTKSETQSTPTRVTLSLSALLLTVDEQLFRVHIFAGPNRDLRRLAETAVLINNQMSGEWRWEDARVPVLLPAVTQVIVDGTSDPTARFDLLDAAVYMKDLTGSPCRWMRHRRFVRGMSLRRYVQMKSARLLASSPEQHLVGVS